MSRTKLVDGIAMPMTAQEEAARDAEEAAWAAAAATRAAAADRSDIANLSREVKAAILAAAALAGKTPAQAKAAFKAAWDSL